MSATLAVPITVRTACRGPHAASLAASPRSPAAMMALLAGIMRRKVHGRVPSSSAAPPSQPTWAEGERPAWTSAPAELTLRAWGGVSRGRGGGEGVCRADGGVGGRSGASGAQEEGSVLLTV